MRLEQLHLGRTLGCGQVFRWRYDDDGWWDGFIYGRPVRLRQDGCDIQVEGGVSEDALKRYFRMDDDLDYICQDILISCGDERMAMLLTGHSGLRLVRQDPWECSASYILATFVNIPRIEKMIDRICATYGRRTTNGRHSFPSPEELLERPGAASTCGLGFRCERFLRFAQAVHDGDVDFDALRGMPYEKCVSELKMFPGIGDKVADCIALFSLDHLEAFPVDVRIMKTMQRLYGIDGTYRRVSADGRALYGKYAGYAQEYLYLGMKDRLKTKTPTPS